MSIDTFASFLAKKRQGLIKDIRDVLPNVEGIETLFEPSEDRSNREVGFMNRKDYDLRIMMTPGPQEAFNQKVYFNFEERYDTKNRKKVFYRYELYWRVNIPFNNDTKYGQDYIDDAMLDLKRSIRFDHHPKQVEKIYHPPYHWHPNGCSEIRFQTNEIEPIHVLLFARIMFHPESINEINKSDHFKRIIGEINTSILKLPIS
jgi:hypothetical protein